LAALVVLDVMYKYHDFFAHSFEITSFRLCRLYRIKQDTEQDGELAIIEHMPKMN